MDPAIVMVEPTDPRLDREQWRQLHGVIEAHGAEVVVLPSPSDAPLAVFVRDLLVCPQPGQVLVMRPEARRGNTEPAVMADAAAARLGVDVTPLPHGLRLDGGQVLHDRDRWLIGLAVGTSGRAERWLADHLAITGAEVHGVPLGVLSTHLDFALAPLAGRGWLRDRRLLRKGGDGLAWDALLGGLPVLDVAEGDLPDDAIEALTCNVIVVGDAVIGDGVRGRVASFVASLGLTPVHVDLSCYRALRGGAHCLTAELQR